MLKKEKDGIVYYEFEHLAKTGLINHCFSTRVGGVSKAPYTSMNLAYHMGDNKQSVDENYRLICKTIGFDEGLIKMTKQIHAAKVHYIENHTVVPEGIDGLITDVSGPVLTTYYADCVPLLFLDPVRKVIANSHSGWRGTMAGIGGKTIKKMINEFKCHPQDILVGIGPSISARHFEVGKEVIEAFKQNMPQVSQYLYQKSEQKWDIDLIHINRQLLIESGILDQNIEVSNLCTFENPDIFYSHRRDGSLRGNMAAMVALK